MAPLIVTPGADNADSYVSVQQATVLLSLLVDAAAWEALELIPRERSLRLATRLLDALVLWKGTRTGLAQALAWPRENVFTRDGKLLDTVTIPMWLEQATALYGYSLGTQPPDFSGGLEGVRRVQDGRSSVEFVPGVSAPATQRIPPLVAGMIQDYGLLAGRGRVPIVRV